MYIASRPMLAKGEPGNEARPIECGIATTGGGRKSCDIKSLQKMSFTVNRS